MNHDLSMWWLRDCLLSSVNEHDDGPDRILSVLKILDGKWKERTVEHYISHDYFCAAGDLKSFFRRVGGSWHII